MNAILVNLCGLVLMAAVAWWFWLWQPRRRGLQSGAIDIDVADGVYEPDVIEARRGVPLTLRFHRRDPSPCAEQVIFQGLDVSASLPVGKTRIIQFTPEQSGVFRFTCQMQMYQGKLRVLD